MDIVEVPPNKDWVTVSASVAAIEKGFHTKLATWENTRSGLVCVDVCNVFDWVHSLHLHVIL